MGHFLSPRSGWRPPAGRLRASASRGLVNTLAVDPRDSISSHPHQPAFLLPTLVHFSHFFTLFYTVSHAPQIADAVSSPHPRLNIILEVREARLCHPQQFERSELV